MWRVLNPVPADRAWSWRWLYNDFTALERVLLVLLVVVLAGIILYNVIDQIRVSVTRKKKVWRAFFSIAAERRLNTHEQNLLIRLIEENGIHPPGRMFQDSRLFDACAAREVAKIKRNPLNYVAKKMRALQITVLRRKLGYTFSPAGQYLESTREIGPGQEVSVSFTRGGAEHIFRATVLLVDDLELVLPVPPEMEGKGIFQEGMELQLSFMHPGVARYEFNTRVQQVTSFRLHLEHAERLKRVQQRRFVRAAVPGTVTFEVTRTPDGRGSKRKYAGQITDISAGGIGFSFGRPVPEGTRVILDMVFGPGESFRNIKGTVLHSYRIGEEGERHYLNHLQFEDLPEPDQDAIIKLIFRSHYSRKK